MVQQRLGDQWSELLSVAPGGHVHLDTMLDQRPPPGSRDWLPLIARAVAYLTSVEGHWVVSMSLGECRRAPLEEVSIDTAFDLVETPEEFEPPAVNRLFEAMHLGASNDDHRVWSVATKERVTEAVSISRSADEAPANEIWQIRLYYVISGL